VTTFRPNAIQQLMKREKLSVSQFAMRASVARTLVAAWLSAIVTPQTATVMRLCRIFNVPVEFFFVDRDDGEKAEPSVRKAGA